MARRSRPRTGAWIETITIPDKTVNVSSRPRTGAWIETRRTTISSGRFPSRPRTGAWIETHGRCQCRQTNHVAPSHGRVD